MYIHRHQILGFTLKRVFFSEKCEKLYNCSQHAAWWKRSVYSVAEKTRVALNHIGNVRTVRRAARYSETTKKKREDPSATT